MKILSLLFVLVAMRPKPGMLAGNGIVSVHSVWGQKHKIT